MPASRFTRVSHHSSAALRSACGLKDLARPAQFALTVSPCGLHPNVTPLEMNTEQMHVPALPHAWRLPQVIQGYFTSEWSGQITPLGKLNPPHIHELQALILQQPEMREVHNQLMTMLRHGITQIEADPLPAWHPLLLRDIQDSAWTQDGQRPTAYTMLIESAQRTGHTHHLPHDLHLSVLDEHGRVCQQGRTDPAPMTYHTMSLASLTDQFYVRHLTEHLCTHTIIGHHLNPNAQALTSHTRYLFSLPL